MTARGALGSLIMVFATGAHGCSVPVGSTLIGDNLSFARNGLQVLWLMTAGSVILLLLTRRQPWSTIACLIIAAYTQTEIHWDGADCGYGARSSVATALIVCSFAFGAQLVGAVTQMFATKQKRID